MYVYTCGGYIQHELASHSSCDEQSLELSELTNLSSLTDEQQIPCILMLQLSFYHQG